MLDVGDVHFLVTARQITMKLKTGNYFIATTSNLTSTKIISKDYSTSRTATKIIKTTKPDRYPKLDNN